jgi:hypothetical protein
MRASLPHNLRERRRSRADQHRRESARPAPSVVVPDADPAVERVRNAGGPRDEASYACACGLVFRAPVSTTVACPHCRAPQAW